jgi:hypothetical protein
VCFKIVKDGMHQNFCFSWVLFFNVHHYSLFSYLVRIVLQITEFQGQCELFFSEFLNLKKESLLLSCLLL